MVFENRQKVEILQKKKYGFFALYSDGIFYK